MKLFDQVVNGLTPRQDRVRIVLDLEADGAGLAKAIKLLQTLREQMDQGYFNQNPSEAVLVLSTGARAWKDALMSLAGQGFGKMIAVHPSPPKK